MAAIPFIIGEVLFDCFPDGHRVLGGAPFNVAWHLAGFGAEPLFLSALGDDEPGREILSRMRAHGMSAEGVQVRPHHATGRVDVVNADTSPEYVFPDVSAWDCFAASEVPAEVEPALLYQGSLFLRGEQSRESSLALAARFACPRFVDVNLRAPWYTPDRIQRLITGIHCLKVSEDELRRLAEWFNLAPQADLVATARALLRAATIDHAFVTLGPEGAVWITKAGEVHRAPAVKVDAFIDSVGAGDASAAVALLGLLKGWPLPLLLERSMQFAAMICGIPGAIPDNADLYHEVSRKWN